MMEMPHYPSVQGQAQPDLGLAGAGMTPDGTAIDQMHGAHFSDSTPSMHSGAPAFQCDDPASELAHLGLDPALPVYQLNLAGSEIEIPSPARLAAPLGLGQVNLPTGSMSDLSQPQLQRGDLTAPGIDAPPALGIDPALSDLLMYAQPGGLNIIAASQNPLAIDPIVPDLDEYDQPEGLEMPDQLSVTSPDLQAPTLTPQVHMSSRPGDLASDALAAMHSDGTYSQLPTSNPRDLWMQQSGTNAARERHIGRLELGLDREEQS